MICYITNGGLALAIEIQKIKFCENCKVETIHQAYEDALEIEYCCTQCHEKTEIVKSFF